ncbi:MAG: sensor histidine kinase [Bryobacteraceae bacterium]|jgi:signal transduction histidine kinase
MSVLRRLSKLDILWLGFGGMIALLVFSAVEAYQIQTSASRHSVEIHRRFAQKGAALSQIRRLLFLGSIYTRDLFLSSRPDRTGVFKAQIERVRGEAETALGELGRLTGPNQSTSELRAHVQGFWSNLESVLDWAEGSSPARGFDFIQREVMPRRNAASALLTAYTEANQSAFANSQAEFDGSRRTAAGRLVVILGLSVALGLIVACFSVVHAASLERESVRRLEEVTRARKDLQQLSARLVESQEAARKRLARELHDEIGQTLHALRIEISHAQAAWKAGEPAAEARLEQARALAERTVETVRNISLLLRPPMLDDLGLGPALQWQAEEFSRRCGIRCTLSEDGLADALPDSHKTCVYRVVQEALHNCEKHSAASNVRILVRQAPRRLSVEIQDDGRGFEAGPEGLPAGPGGLGILGMRERATTLDGSLRLDSAPGKGTQLTLSLPLPEAAGTAAPNPEEVPA